MLDADFAPMWAAQQGIEESIARVARARRALRAAVQEGVDAANEKLAQSRTDQEVHASSSGDWLPGGDELTPTMKLKRKPIAEKYGAAIDAMYSG